MRCSKSARSVSTALVVAAILAALPSAAQERGSSEEDDRAENMRMPNVSIEGERQTPDIFFVFPTGKGGNMSAPRMRDYAADILEPVVKPWFERDQSVNPQVRVSTGQRFNWDAALRSEPDRAPAPQAPPPVNQAPAMQAPAPPAGRGQLGGYPTGPTSAPPQIPSQARSLPEGRQPGIPAWATKPPPDPYGR